MADVVPFDEALAERIRHHIGPRKDVEEKRMFGGLCFMVRGHMAVGVTKERLMVRLDPNDGDAALSEPFVSPMDFTGKPMRGFVFVAPGGTKGDQALGRWVTRAVAFAESKPPK